MAKTDIKAWTLDIEKGAMSYDESLKSVLAKAVESEIKDAAKDKRKIDVSKIDPRVRLEATTASLSAFMDEAINGIDLRECAIVFGTVIGREFGTYMAKKQVRIEQLVDILEAFAFAATDTSERVVKAIQ